jgi:hypothetical protein
MDQRTRERLPVLPALIAWADAGRTASAGRLQAARDASAGSLFTVGGQTLRRAVMKTETTGRIWAEDPAAGKRRDLTFEEHRGFWCWAMIEVLRHTGIRIEELTELSHHSLIQYRLPASKELIPLLQIAPSKTDEERLLVVSPELAEVLSAIVRRIRGAAAVVPLVISYDKNERVYNPPMPLLFQWRCRLENRPSARPRCAATSLPPAATADDITAHDQQCAELARHKLGRLTSDDADGYHRVICPAAAGKIRCPLRPASMTLTRDRTEILQPPAHPPACCTQQTITVPPAIAAKTRQKHDYPRPR